MFPNRGLIAISGEDRVSFLQGLVTNDVGAGPVYACLLTAQGRFLHDFFVVPDGDRLLIDCEADRRDDLIRRLKQFRLRAKVEIEEETGSVVFDDPRHPSLGQRNVPNEESYEDWDRKRIALGVPDGSRDMVPQQALLLESNIDRLNGIAWDKGCYIGQELTARMHHRGGVKRRLTPVRIEGPAPAPGTMIMAGEKEAGEMRSSCGDIGLALLRLDAAMESLMCDGVPLYPLDVIASEKRSNAD